MAKIMKLMGASSIAALMAAAPQPETEADGAEEAESGPEPEGEGTEGEGTEGEAASTDDGDEEVEAVSTDDAAAFAREQRAEGVAAGTKAERTRTSKVLGSEEGKANYADASFMLAHTDASADKIIAELKSRGPQGTLLEIDTTAGIEDTNVDLGRGTDPANALDEGAGGKDVDPWAGSLDRVSAANGLTAPFAPAAAQQNAAGNITIPASHNGVGY